MKKIMICIALIVLACSKDKIDNPFMDSVTFCKEKLNQLTVPIDSIYVKTDIHHQCFIGGHIFSLFANNSTYPSVNPMNSNQIAFIKLNMDTPSFNNELCVFDICTGELRVIAHNALSGTDWSTKDWILYSSGNHQLWKVKSNGDSLTQLTNNSSYNRRSSWSPNGEQYIYNESNSQSNQYKICYDDGTLYKDISGNLGYPNWVTSNEIYYVNNSFLGRYNIAEEEFSIIFEAESLSMVYGNKESLILSSKDGFYIQNNNGFQLRDTSYRTYGSSFVQPLDNDLLLVNRSVSDTTYYFECKVYNGSFLTIFDLNTNQEKRLLVPY